MLMKIMTMILIMTMRIIMMMAMGKVIVCHPILAHRLFIQLYFENMQNVPSLIKRRRKLTGLIQHCGTIHCWNIRFDKNNANQHEIEQNACEQKRHPSSPVEKLSCLCKYK